MGGTDLKGNQTGSLTRLSTPHQALRALHSYWLSKKGSRIAPPRAAIWPDELRALLPNIALVEVIGTPPRFRFRLFGSNLVDAYGEDITGRFADEVDLDGIGCRIHDDATSVVRERRASVAQIAYKTGDGRHLQYERVLLPLSDDGETVNMILIGYAIERAG